MTMLIQPQFIYAKRINNIYVIYVLPLWKSILPQDKDI